MSISLLNGTKVGYGDLMLDVPPTHDFAEFDHAGSEPLRRLREDLHRPAGHIVGSRDGVDGLLVAQIAKLEGQVEPAVSTSEILFFLGALW